MAGQSMRELKRRIRGVKSTQQITKAMEMVAAAKFRRAQQQLLTSLPFNEKLEEILGHVMRHGDVKNRLKGLHPLLEEREVKRVAYVIVAADRGLAGGYNANVMRLAYQTIQEDSREKLILAVGRRARDFLVRRDVPLFKEGLNSDYVYIGDELEYDESRFITRVVRHLYEQGEVDEVYIIYNMYVSATSYQPTVTKLLPIEMDDLPGNGDSNGDEGEEEPMPIFEPSPERLLSALLPRFIDMKVYGILLGAKASEQGARMMAMRNATDNAEEMIHTLTLSFNRARQNSITTELSEIVGGANALSGGE